MAIAPCKVLIASDHAGFELKRLLQEQLGEIDWEDLGPASADRVDYPDFAAKDLKDAGS